MRTIIADAFPTEGSVLPPNAKPVVYFRTIGGSPQLFRDDGREELPFLQFFNGAVIPDVGPLESGTTLTIDARCENCDFRRSWSIGNDPDVDAPILPEEAIGTSLRFASSGVSDRFTFQVVVPRIDDPHVMYETTHEGLTSLFLAATEGATTIRLGLSSEPDAGGVRCVGLTAVDLAGNRAAFPEELCVDLADAPRRETGCNSTPGCAASALAIVLLGLRRSRKRPS